MQFLCTRKCIYTVVGNMWVRPTPVDCFSLHFPLLCNLQLMQCKCFPFKHYYLLVCCEDYINFPFTENIRFFCPLLIILWRFYNVATSNQTPSGLLKSDYLQLRVRLFHKRLVLVESTIWSARPLPQWKHNNV
uniref:Uncharacterized protein n=1 Tax=Cacopsylla melanoneura TaxID=428564 RepID=A0A8D8VEI7_9HEMI